MFESTPCTAQDTTLAIVNALFNGLQMLLLTWLGARMSRLSHNSDIRLQRELDQKDTH